MSASGRIDTAMRDDSDPFAASANEA
jgi:hypothetical protein